MATKLDQLSEDTRDELAALALRLSGDKKTRKSFLGLIKEAAPETPIPEIDEVNAMQEELKKRDERIDKLEKARDAERFADSLGRQKNEARAKYELSDEDFSKMEEMMKKGELPADYRFAPQIYKQQLQLSTPTNYGSGGYGPVNIEGYAKNLNGILEDTDNWASNTAHSMIDEMQRQRSASKW